MTTSASASASASAAAAPGSGTVRRVLAAIPFALAHLACLAAIWTGVGAADLAIAAGLYAVRMFAITAGYHRYFSHRGFRTSRAFAFVLAVLAQSSAQRGVLWWAGNHRRHHRFSDTARDVHSPVRRGFWYAHLGWFFADEYDRTDLDAIPDFARYPELVWLDRHPYLPAFLMGLVVWLCAGWSGLVAGFLWSTVALWHATFSINSLAHVMGRRRYVTGDQSRNNPWLALLTFGEGWHNNHHHYQSAARQGFRWYEIDVSYYALKALAAARLVWDLRSPPAHVVQSEQRLRRAVIERAAAQLAASFHGELLGADLRARLAEKRAALNAALDELHDGLSGVVTTLGHRLEARAHAARLELHEALRAAHLRLPAIADMRARAEGMFAATPSMNDIVERARLMLIDHLIDDAPGGRGAIAAQPA